MTVFMYQADMYCEECGKLYPQEPNNDQPHDSNEYAISYPDAGEADTPIHCGRCFTLLDCTLTDDGREYVREALADGSGDPEILRQWRDTFYLDETGS
jgi:hypothetical protein